MESSANSPLREEVKALWKLCFTDGDDFTDLYFRLRYSDDINLCLQADGRVVCALQLLPYPLTYLGHELKADYISGACTHPDYRKHGLMRRLLQQSFRHSHRNAVDLSFLIPANPPLYDYYARSGYTTLFHYSRRLFTCTSAPMPSGLRLAQTDAYSPAILRYLTRKQKERPCCILHTEADFRVILANLQLCGGAVYTLCNDGEKTGVEKRERTDADKGKRTSRAGECLYKTSADASSENADRNTDEKGEKTSSDRECLYKTISEINTESAERTDAGNAKGSTSEDTNIVALAIVFPTETDGMTVGEILADTIDLQTSLLNAICHEHGVNTLCIETPTQPGTPCLRLGMARIIRPLPILNLYAAAHPETAHTFYLIDPDLSANTGRYTLNHGTCRFQAEQPQPGVLPILTIQELTYRILSPLQPYMSLMLNE